MKQIQATGLKMWRFYKQMSQKELQARTGIDQAKISHIERGYVMPKPDEQKRICEALKIQPGDIEFFLVTDYDNV